MSGAVYTSSWGSPLGRLVLTSDGEALVGLRFDDGARRAAGVPRPAGAAGPARAGEATGAVRAAGGAPGATADAARAAVAVRRDDVPVLGEARRWLALYFAGDDPGFVPALRPRGSAFQLAVWRQLLTVPWGETRSYGDVARAVAAELGRERMSAQAVGGAVGHNPLCLVVPCHRVVGADGSLVGYGPGLWRKRWLLDHEAR